MKSILTQFLALALFSPILAGETGSEKDLTSTRKKAFAMQKAILDTRDNEKVKEIIASGFDVSSPIGCGKYSALYGAIDTRNKEIIRTLLEAGARPDDEIMLRAFGTYDRELDIPKMFIEAGGNTLAFTRHGSCLYKAVWYGNLPLVNLILSQEKVDLDRPGWLGTPLCLAIRKGYTEVATVLLDKGADPHQGGNNKKAEKAITAAQIIEQRIKELTAIQKRMRQPAE